MVKVNAFKKVFVQKVLPLVLVLLCMSILAFAESTDVRTSASQVYYVESSLTIEELSEAIQNSEGACTVATVNADGSPLLVGGSPALLNNTHIAFGWNNNVTLENMQRTGQAMMCYYVFDQDQTEKFDKHSGARVVLEVEKDEKVLEDLKNAYPSLPPYAILLKITQLLPLG